MKSIKQLSHSERETRRLGQTLAKYLKGGDIVCLKGDLGSGKTTFVKGVAKGLNIVPTKVNSPTFVLMNVYEGKLPLFHFDLYRMEGEEDISGIGYEEFFYDDGVSVVEWAEKLKTLFPDNSLTIEFKHAGEHQRLIKIKAQGSRYKTILEKLNKS